MEVTAREQDTAKLEQGECRPLKVARFSAARESLTLQGLRLDEVAALLRDPRPGLHDVCGVVGIDGVACELVRALESGLPLPSSVVGDGEQAVDDGFSYARSRLGLEAAPVEELRLASPFD